MSHQYPRSRLTVERSKSIFLDIATSLRCVHARASCQDGQVLSPLCPPLGSVGEDGLYAPVPEFPRTCRAMMARSCRASDLCRVSRAAHVFFSGCFGKRDDDLPPAYDPTIGLCDKLKGSKVHIEGTLVSGTGSVLGDSPVLQDKAYFELTIRTEGTFAVGVATKDTPLEGVISHEKVPTAWTLTSNMQSLPPLPAGSTLGVALDQGDFPVQVYFYLDGKVRAAAIDERHQLPQRWPPAQAGGRVVCASRGMRRSSTVSPRPPVSSRVSTGGPSGVGHPR